MPANSRPSPLEPTWPCVSVVTQRNMNADSSPSSAQPRTELGRTLRLPVRDATVLVDLDHRHRQPERLPDALGKARLLPCSIGAATERDQDVVRREHADGVVERGQRNLVADEPLRVSCRTDRLDIAEHDAEALVRLFAGAVGVVCPEMQTA